ncbi:MAG: hypothetical protein KIT79_10690 [Deltaproteobacteria bacterium]|nr:hypothetical protein [Deltaproteobacteria bacterium]
MAMDLDKMVEKCERGQWNVNSFDWAQKPIPLSKEKELQVCQYYTDMSYIERLAGALFLALSQRVEDPRLKRIFELCHADEVRHSIAAAKLADYFNVHNYKFYTPNLWMLQFIPSFVKAVKTINPAFATSFILGGELILDIALLRGLNEYVDDPLSREVVERINQDESRHIAMDFYMTEYFSRNRGKRASDDKTPGWLKPEFWGMLAWGPGFFNDVFFRPMQIVDPGNHQMKEVMKRLRRFNDREEVKNNPTVKNFKETVEFFESPVGSAIGTVLEKAIHLTTGIDFSFVRAASTENMKGLKEAQWTSADGTEANIRNWATA